MREEGKFILFTRDEFNTWLEEQSIKRKVTFIQNHHTYKPDYSSFKGNNHFQLAKSMERYHMQDGKMSEIAQNFSTFNDGTIMLCRNLEKNPGCFLGSKNNVGAICIEHVGNFDIGKDAMTEEHRRTILFLNAVLCKKFALIPSINTLVYHHFVAEKSCPGTNFFGGNTKEAAKTIFIPLVVNVLNSLDSKSNVSDPAPSKDSNNNDSSKRTEKVTELEKAINYLKEMGIIDSPDYWINNAVEGKTIKGEYAATLITKIEKKFNVSK